MAAGNSDTSSQPLTEETPTAKKLRFTTSCNHQPHMLPGRDVLHAPSDTVPMDLIAEILARLPVKSLLRLTSVCKSWNALISDYQFAKPQLRASASDPNRRHLIVTSFNPLSRKPLLMDYSLRSLFNNYSSPPGSSSQRNLPFEGEPNSYYYFFGSCHGMLCLATNLSRPLLWNPSTGKLKNLPSFNWQDSARMEYGFGYDHLSDTYKVVAVSMHEKNTWSDDGYRVVLYETDVMVHTLGTDSWRPIQKFPAPFVANIKNFPAPFVAKIGCGEFVNGTLNWLVGYLKSPYWAVVSLDLGTETYQQLFPPDCPPPPQVGFTLTLTTDVLKGCLCILARSHHFWDVWVMKDYGNNESWTRLIRVGVRYAIEDDEIYPFLNKISRPLYTSDDGDEILLHMMDEPNLVVYNCKSGILVNPMIKTLSGHIAAVYTESLISPRF